MQDIMRLMLRYRNAIEACGAVPALSVWPVLKFTWQSYVWLLCFDFAFLTGIVDLPLLLIRKIFGWPRFVLGRWLYDYLRRPFRSLWAGEIPSFRIVRVRYLTRLMILYHAQARLDALRRAFNLRHLALLADASGDRTAVASAQDVQEAFDLFTSISKDRYQIGALVVFGPLLTVLSLVTQKLLVPIIHDVLDYLAKTLDLHSLRPSELLQQQVVQSVFVAAALVVIYAVWLLMSAWMDKRAIFAEQQVRAWERRAFATCGLPWRPELQLDLIGFSAIWLGCCLATFLAYVYADSLTSYVAVGEDVEQFRSTLLGYTIITGGATLLGLLSLVRRTYLANSSAAPEARPS